MNKIVDASEKSHEDRQSIISEFHDLPAAGHKGNKATYNVLRKHYRWYVKHCQRCQKGKATNKAPAGELLPLPTPQGPWQDITVDFTEMPESLGYNNILVVVDRFSKEVVFIPCTKEENALTTAKLFRDHVWCQHGLPSSVVSDRGSIFASHFMGELYKILEIKQKMSTAFHPQTDGQTERLNREINTYLRIYVSDRQCHDRDIPPQPSHTYLCPLAVQTPPEHSLTKPEPIPGLPDPSIAFPNSSAAFPKGCCTDVCLVSIPEAVNNIPEHI